MGRKVKYTEGYLIRSVVIPSGKAAVWERAKQICSSGGITPFSMIEKFVLDYDGKTNPPPAATLRSLRVQLEIYDASSEPNKIQRLDELLKYAARIVSPEERRSAEELITARGIKLMKVD